MSNDHEIAELLLVEDNDNDLELTLRALRTNNLANRVFVVRDGKEALDYIFGKSQYSNRNGIFDLKLILLDLKLPKVNGIEVLKTIKSDEKTKNIPVVALTSSKETSDLRKCYDLGINSYIVKPFDFDDFVKAIAAAGLYWLVINQPAP